MKVKELSEDWLGGVELELKLGPSGSQFRVCSIMLHTPVFVTYSYHDK